MEVKNSGTMWLSESVNGGEDVYKCIDLMFLLPTILLSWSTVFSKGFPLILAILRTFGVRDEAARVMVSSPIIGLKREGLFRYGRNKADNVGAWAGQSLHPSRWKLWGGVVAGGILVTLLKTFDFAPYWGFVDARVVSHTATIPLTSLMWSFVRDDSEFSTTTLIKKPK